MAAVALKVPAALGVKAILIVALWPAATVRGRVGALREKYWVEIATLLTVTDAEPEFVAVTVRVSLLPAATLPKFRVAAPKESVLLCCWPEGPPALTPWQPVKSVRPTASSKAPATFPRCFWEICLDAVFSIVTWCYGTAIPQIRDCLGAGRPISQFGAPGRIAVDI